jgi:hypothetical protein
LELDEFGELERQLLADGWIRFAKREHRVTILDLLPAGPKLREAKQVSWRASPFTMSLVGFDHAFATAGVPPGERGIISPRSCLVRVMP